MTSKILASINPKIQLPHTLRYSPDEVSIIKARLQRGDYQHRIAADYDLNQGRISEIAKGKRFAHVSPAKLLGEQGGSSRV